MGLAEELTDQSTLPRPTSLLPSTSTVVVTPSFSTEAVQASSDTGANSSDLRSMITAGAVNNEVVVFSASLE